LIMSDRRTIRLLSTIQLLLAEYFFKRVKQQKIQQTKY
jgi:hypothetical protein